MTPGAATPKHVRLNEGLGVTTARDLMLGFAEEVAES
jgi:hypothetical protein